MTAHIKARAEQESLPRHQILSMNSKKPRVAFAMNSNDWDTFFRRGLSDFPGQLGEVSGRIDGDYATDRAEWEKALHEFQPEVLVTCWSTPPLPRAWAGAADGALKYVCHVTGSVRKLVPREFMARGGRVTNWGGLAGREVAEHALLLAMAALRRMPEWRTYRGVAFGPSATVRLGTSTLYGRRVGIHGFGNVARSLVELLKPFGVEILAYSDGVPDEFVTSFGVRPCASLEEIFSQSEVLFECEALTPKSQQSVTGEMLSRLADGAVFVNVGRAEVVNEEALVHEAASGRLQVAVDVTVHEPPTPDNPLARLANTIVSPHIAGPTWETFPLCGDMALRNVESYLRGESLAGEMSLDAYDRST